MSILTSCIKSFTSLINYEQGLKDIETLKTEVKETQADITKSADSIKSYVAENYAATSELEAIQKDFSTSISQTSSDIRMEFSSSITEVKQNVTANESLLEEYIRFKGALIEMGKVGNAFTSELDNEKLAFKENGVTIAYISNQKMYITSAEITSKLSIGGSVGYFDFIAKANGHLSIVYRDLPASASTSEGAYDEKDVDLDDL